MFQKPPFGSTNTSTFGSFNAGASTSSPFGGFKPTTGTSAFGAPPTFGAGTATQPTTGGGLFGSTNTSGGLFGASTASTSTPAFGASTSGFGFGASTSTGGLFGGNTGTGLFGNTQNTSAFGAKPAGFGFGATSTATPSTGGLFGSTPAATTGLFGQQNNTMSGGGIFSNNTGAFGQQQTASGTAHMKYSPVVGTDVVVKGGTSQNINIKHHCITCMKEYENKSLEELRLEDYQAGRKGAQAGGMFGGFSATQQENKPLFGGSTFGQPAATTASSVFGAGGLSTSTGFGQTNTFAFGSNAQNTTNTTSLFNKPAFGATPSTGTPLFGATTTQAPTFGTSTSTFGFGTNTQNQTGGLFGAKPATSTAFGALPGAGFGGGFGSTNMFQNKPQQAPPAFGAQQPAFGSVGAFGTATSSAPLFGSAFGKPATAAPAFGTALPQPQPTGAGLGTGLGANSFQVKPGGFGGGSLFQPQQNTSFRTDSGLGSGMFGNTSTLGAPSLGMGLNANNSMMNNTSVSGATSGNVHEQMLTLAARPYGDSPLFKDLLPDSSSNAEEALKPTNPAAMKAVLDSSGPQYRLDQRPPALKLHPRTAHDKKSLFDGLEESDASLEDKLSLKPSRKRLVLRPNNQRSEAACGGQRQDNNRSLEEQPSETNINGAYNSENRDQPDSATEQERPKRSVNFDDQNADSNADKNGSWLSSSKMQWNEKEKAIDNEPTPRLYPNIDKELSTQVSERRASWLTTKPLRKPLVSNPDSAENSVRELGVRTPERLSSDKENIDSLSESVSSDQLQFCLHRGGERCTSCEKIAHQISGIYVSEEENVAPREMPPHPTGVKLTRPGYYTIPSLDEMIHYIRPDGSCVVPHLTIGRHNYGNVFYDCEVDVAGLDLDSLVHFLNKEIIVYPEDSDKPPVGSGLNRRAVVTLDRVWPRDKSQRRPITDPDRLLKMDYENKLRRVCYKHDTKFIEYRPQTGSWVFRVEHFSKYGLTDSDEEDDGPTPEVLKRQIANQALQKAAPLPGVKPPPVQSPGLGGLGGLGSLGGLGGLPAAPAEDTLLAMHQTSLNLLNGAGKAFEMDTTEDNAESQSLYHPDNRAFGVKSPTSELARLENRRSHHVQLMKASLYADTEMEDDVSVSTGDQLVPISAPTAVPGRPASIRLSEHTDTMDVSPDALEVLELPMRPLIVRPHTIVLQYHRKVPPFKDTIAGRLNAAYIADMSVCRARHSRAGFGPRANIAYVTSLDSVSHLPRDAELCDLGRYVRGRAADDWSESVVTRLAIAQGDSTNYIQESLSRHLETLLKYSDLTDVPEGQCPRLRVRDAPRDRRQLLLEHIRDAKALATGGGQKFGVTSTYCLQVWTLCEALWGADLENGGVPGTDVASIVHRHRKFLEWMQDVVSEETDDELSKPTKGEDEDEGDGHSARIWTLLVGGRILEACKVSREHGDLNMAALIAQASGDPNFRSLLSRQLSQWAECGADTLISSHKLACVRLLAGHSTSLLNLLSWSRALLAVYKYICPQIPSLERAIRTYEGFFNKNDDEVDLSTLEPDQTGMQLPLPPYMAEYEMYQNGHQRRVLDLRYCLVRARATNSRPKLRPEAYTPQPFDYSLCFLLGAWFGDPSVDSINGVADQLEACGLWHLAVQALAYHPDDVCRGHLIRGVLSRHAPAQADTPELKSRLELIKKLGVPEKWLLLAQAHRAKYERLPLVEAMLLSGAGQWNAAHRVLVDELLPEAVLSDNLDSIAALLEQLNQAASRHEVSGWESGGQALYHYANICKEIRGLVSSADVGTGVAGERTRVSTRLEALRPSVAAACNALAQIHPKTARMAAARAEMGARAVQLALASGAPPHHAARLLRALRLPPASAARHCTQITQELAEQASDSCIESASSSPLSSHHRTTVQS